MKNKELAKEYYRAYRLAHKDKFKEYADRWKSKNKEKVNDYRKEYYNNHKDEIMEKQKDYVKRNRQKVTNLVLKRRKEVALELKEQGQIWTYLPKTARENKMCESLAKKLHIDETQARKMLIENNWNYKKLREEARNNASA